MNTTRVGLILFLIFSFLFGEKKIKTKKEKFIYLEDILFISYLILLAGALSYGPDFDVYQRAYDSAFYIRDKGYGVLLFILKSIGFDVKQIRLFIAVFCVILIYATGRRYLNRRYIKWLYICYFVYPYFLDMIQLRNWLAMSIFIFSLPFLSKEDFSSKCKFLLLVLIAGSMQKTLFAFAPLVLFKSMNHRKAFKVFFSLVAICVVFLGSNKGIVLDVELFLLTNFGEKLGITVYLQDLTNWGWLISWVQTFLNIFIMYLINRSCSFNRTNLNEENKKTKMLFEIGYLVNIYSIFFLPLYVISVDFFRLCRNLQVINIIILIRFFQEKRYQTINISKEKKYLIMALALIEILIGCYFGIVKDHWNTIVINAFNNNWILR